ncbi:hypothetical protein [Sporosarcina sp. FSL K6-1508]
MLNKLCGGAAMVRSLSFIHLFVILAIGYIGGALLFREMPATSVERIVTFYDARVVLGHDAGYIRPVGTAVLFFVLAYALAMYRRTQFAVLFFGAVKCVLFGLSSSYLLASGTKMMAYSIWWFPFQFLICFLFLVYCAVLSPPYFMRTTLGKRSNTRALPAIIGMATAVLAIEIIVFQFILN